MKARVDDLFRVCGEVSVLGKTVYLRTLTEAQDAQRVDYALEGARELRRRLRSEEGKSDPRLRNVLEMGERELRDAATALQRVRLERAAFSEVTRGEIAEPPDDPTLAAVLDVMDTNEEGEREVAARRREWVREKLDAFVEEIKAWEIEQLRQWVYEETIASACDAEFGVRFARATIALSCYKDPEMKKPWFANIEQVREASQRFHNAVLFAYRELDSFTVEDLKN